MARKLFPAGKPRFGFSRIPRAERIPYLEREIKSAQKQVQALRSLLEPRALSDKGLSGRPSDVESDLQKAEQRHEMLKAALLQVKIKENRRVRGK